MPGPEDMGLRGLSKLREKLADLVRDVFQEPRQEEFSYAAHMLTHTGLVRGHNEDSIAYAIFTGAAKTRRSGFLGLVADGMGGHAHGEVASRIAVETTMSVYSANPDVSPTTALARGFEAANKSILTMSATQPEHTGMGTTCTALAVEAGYAVLCHIGDSRAYLWRAGEISQISDDHSLVAQMVRSGLITEQDALTHPDRNVIVSALGLDEGQEPDVWSSGLPVEAGDVFCLCSDGLSNLVPVDVIGAALAQLEPELACTALLKAALDGGGHDNVSVGVFRVEPLHKAGPSAITARLVAAGADEQL